MKIAAKSTVLVLGLAVALTTQAQAYETDDFGFPVAQNTSRQTTNRFASSRTLQRFRIVRPARAQYCPPVTTTVTRVPAQPARTQTLVRQASPTAKARTVSVAKTRLSATQAPVAQPSS